MTPVLLHPPTLILLVPTASPTAVPTKSPTRDPTTAPTASPTEIRPTAITMSMLLSGIAEADFDSALQASLQTDIAGTAGVAPNRVTITGVTFTEDSPPIAVVDYTIVFAGVAAGNAAAAALEAPILTNLSAQEAAVEVSYEGSKITISGSISLFGIGVWADLDSDDAVGLEVALLTDLAIAAGVTEYDVDITIITTVQDSPPLVTAEYTVSFASKAAADAGKAALEEPTLATLGAYVSTATGESIGAAVSHAGSRVSTGVEVAPTDSPTPVPTLVPTGTPTDPPTAGRLTPRPHLSHFVD